MSDSNPRAPDRTEGILTVTVFGLLLAFHAWGVAVGWHNNRLPGNEFRQTQTAITALFIQRDHDFSLAYPTPVLGKPWSIPFEFPLYQWTVVWVSDATHLSLIHAGRAVSVACFYLTLPALWLLLGRLGVAGTRRLIVLGMVLICPLYIFYTRAFLIETMALMFSLWFLHAFVQAVEQRSWRWLVLANVAGMGAGLVKVTTFMLYLIPAGVWSLWWLWRVRPGADGTARSWRPLAHVAGWIAAGSAVPFAATYGWIRFSDAVKALNPSSQNLTSAAMHSYNFGTWATRFSAAIWKDHLHVTLTNLMPATVLVMAGMLVMLFAGRWRWWIAGCLGLFLGVQLMFPILYAWHEYYFVANGVLLMVAAGLALCGLLESATRRWAVWVIIGGLYFGQAVQYLNFLYPVQLYAREGTTELTEALQVMTHPDDVLVIAGEDWGSMTPFYARRRALMIRRDMERDWSYVPKAFDLLKGERVTALVLTGAQRENQHLRELATRYFDIDPKPFCSWQNSVVYLARELRAAATVYIDQQHFVDLQLTDKLDPGQNPLLRHEVAVSSLVPAQQELFRAMSPRPVRVYTTFGMNLTDMDGRPAFGAHPDTRLWFALSPGVHEVDAEYALAPGAYVGISRNEATDGVEFVVNIQKADGTREPVFDRLLNPRDNFLDRGFQRLHLTIEVGRDCELLLETGPGARGNYNRDWAAWGPITIK